VLTTKQEEAMNRYTNRKYWYNNQQTSANWYSTQEKHNLHWWSRHGRRRRYRLQSKYVISTTCWQTPCHKQLWLTNTVLKISNLRLQYLRLLRLQEPTKDTEQIIRVFFTSALCMQVTELSYASTVSFQILSHETNEIPVFARKINNIKR